MSGHRRRQVLAAIGTTGAALAGATGAAAAPGDRAGASAPDTLFEIVAASSDFDTLESALETTGLDATLDGGGGQYTVFAPTDTAFEGVDTSGLTTAELTAILLYHVTRGRRYAASVASAPQVRTLNGVVTVDGTTLNDGQAEIDATNVEASNGVAHVIDGVLLP